MLAAESNDASHVPEDFAIDQASPNGKKLSLVIQKCLLRLGHIPST